jgi:hypothetical protein
MATQWLHLSQPTPVLLASVRLAKAQGRTSQPHIAASIAELTRRGVDCDRPAPAPSVRDTEFARMFAEFTASNR